MTTVRSAQVGQGGPVRIACMNLAKTDLGVPFDKLTATLQKCYNEFFLPVWGYPVTLYNTTTSQPTDWQFVYFDNADTAGALGYHDITKDGQPVSKVFVETTLSVQELVSVTACHELFEMVIDPIANLWAEGEDGTQYAYEMCDAVEEDTFSVDGIQMSNFLHPAWFEPFRHPTGTRFDHLGRLKKPFSMTKGGYMITMKNGKVREVFGSAEKRKRFKQEVRKCHRSEYRKPAKDAKLVAPVSKRVAARNMEALRRQLAAGPTYSKTKATSIVQNAFAALGKQVQPSNTLGKFPISFDSSAYPGLLYQINAAIADKQNEFGDAIIQTWSDTTTVSFIIGQVMYAPTG